MFAQASIAPRFFSSSRAVLARCQPTNSDASERMSNPADVPTSTSQGGVKDTTRVELDVPTAPVQTAVLGRTQGETPCQAAAVAGAPDFVSSGVWTVNRLDVPGRAETCERHFYKSSVKL